MQLREVVKYTLNKKFLMKDGKVWVSGKVKLLSGCNYARLQGCNLILGIKTPINLQLQVR